MYGTFKTQGQGNPENLEKLENSLLRTLIGEGR